MSEEKTVYPCPLCGCSLNRRGSPFTEPGQTVAHINGGHDERHTGERGEDHLNEIRENGRQVTEAEVEQERVERGSSRATASGGVERETTVELGAFEEPEEVPVSEAVEVHDEMLAEPEAHGLAKGEGQQEAFRMIVEQREMIDELEENVGELAEMLEIVATLFDGKELAEAREEVRESGSVVDWDTDMPETGNRGYQ